jgi:hypothetical protein
MTPNQKTSFAFLSFFLVLLTIACSCGTLIPTGGGTPVPFIPSVTSSFQDGSDILPGSPLIDQATDQVTVPAGGSATAIASCPSGSLLLGGGFASAAGIRITKSMPDPDVWLVTGLNTTNGDLPLTAYATCLHNSAGSVRVESAEVLVSGAPRALCQTGEILTGGGYAFETNTLEVYISTPVGNPAPFSWSVNAHNLQDADQTITVYAVCLSGSGYTASLVRDAVAFAPGTGLLNFSMTCPAGSSMVSGGYEGTGAFISRISATDPAVWEVQVQDKIYDDGSLDHAVCLSLP